MKINNFITLNNIYANINDELLQEGSLIKGEVLDVIDDFVILDIKDIGVLKAFNQKDLREYKGKVLNFIVKSSQPDQIELKPILNDVEEKQSAEINNRSENYLSKVLKEFNIKNDPISIELLDNLTKHNVQINKENVLDGIRIVEKLEQLVNLDDKQQVILPNSEEVLSIGKEDIRNLLIITEDKDIAKKSLTPMVKEYLNTSFDDKLQQDIIKAISLFIKYNIKPSLNNIKYFLELRDNPNLFSEDFKKIEEFVDKKFTNLNKRIIINKGTSKNLIEESNIKYSKTLDKINNYIRENSPIIDKNIKESIEELKNKIEFLEEMNKELTFVYLPLNIDDNLYKGFITLLKKKKSKNKPNSKINVFINLSTERLGNVKISCEVFDRFINIKFNNINERDIKLFKLNENDLKSLVQSTGYKIASIEYLYEKSHDFIDSLIENPRPIYFLDVKV